MRFWSLGHRDVPSTTGPCHFTLVSYRVYLIGEEQGKHISYSPRARCLERAVLQRTPRLLSRYPIRSLQSLFFPLCWTLDNLTHWSIYITALYVIERINSRVLPVYRLQWVDESMVRCEFSCILGLTAILYVWVKDCTMGCFGFFLSTGCSEVAKYCQIQCSVHSHSQDEDYPRYVNYQLYCYDLVLLLFDWTWRQIDFSYSIFSRAGG